MAQKFITLIQNTTPNERHLMYCNRHVPAFGCVELDGVWPSACPKEYLRDIMLNEIKLGSVKVMYFSDGGVHPISSLEAVKIALRDQSPAPQAPTMAAPVQTQPQQLPTQVPQQQLPNGPQSFLQPSEQFRRESEGSLLPNAQRQTSQLLHENQQVKAQDAAALIGTQHPDMMPRGEAPEWKIQTLPGVNPVSGQPNGMFVLEPPRVNAPPPAATVENPAPAVDVRQNNQQPSAPAPEAPAAAAEPAAPAPAAPAEAPTSPAPAAGKGKGKGKGNK